MKEKDKEKKPESDSNIQVAIRVRPLAQKELQAGDSDIVRAQDNLIVHLNINRLFWTRLRHNIKWKAKRSSMCSIDPKNRDMRSTKFIETKLLKKSMRKLSKPLSKLS